MHGHILACEPPRLLAYTWSETSDPNSEVRFELSTAGKDVRLVLTHSRLASRDSMVGASGGWHTHLGRAGRAARGADAYAILGDIHATRIGVRPADTRITAGRSCGSGQGPSGTVTRGLLPRGGTDCSETRCVRRSNVVFDSRSASST